MSRPDKFWDRLADNYDETVEKMETSHGRTVEKMKKYLRTGDVVLDYGCANGLMSCEVAGIAEKIYGLDTSPKMIEAAKRKAAELNIGNVDFARTTVFDERYRRESFDAVLALGVLHLEKDPRVAVRRINELLKPGGRLISVTACMGEARAFIKILFPLFGITGIVPRMRLLKFEELEGLIAGGKFQIIEKEIYPADQGRPIIYLIIAQKAQ